MKRMHFTRKPPLVKQIIYEGTRSKTVYVRRTAGRNSTQTLPLAMPTVVQPTDSHSQQGVDENLGGLGCSFTSKSGKVYFLFVFYLSCE